MKREVVQRHSTDRRYAHRDKDGQFSSDQVNVGKSLSAGRPSKAKTIVPKGQGDRGDQKHSLGTTNGMKTGPASQDVVVTF